MSACRTRRTSRILSCMFPARPGAAHNGTAHNKDNDRAFPTRPRRFARSDRPACRHHRRTGPSSRHAVSACAGPPARPCARAGRLLAVDPRLRGCERKDASRHGDHIERQCRRGFRARHDSPPSGRDRHGQNRSGARQGPADQKARRRDHQRPGAGDRLDAGLAEEQRALRRPIPRPRFRAHRRRTRAGRALRP